jgi:hypothetical protein
MAEPEAVQSAVNPSTIAVLGVEILSPPFGESPPDYGI